MSNRKKTKSSVPQAVTALVLPQSQPKVMYDELGRILIEENFMGRTIQHVLDTGEPLLRRALVAIGWVPPNSNIEQEAYQSVAALIGAGATFQEVVDFLMVKLGVNPDTPEVHQSEVKHRNAVAQIQKDFGHYFQAIVRARTPEEEVAACKALATAVNADLDAALNGKQG